MIRTMMTTTMLALGFIAFTGLSATAAPIVRSKTTMVAQGEPAAPASDAPAPQKKSEKKTKGTKGDKKANVTKEKGKAKGSTTEVAPAAAPASEKAPEKN